MSGLSSDEELFIRWRCVCFKSSSARTSTAREQMDHSSGLLPTLWCEPRMFSLAVFEQFWRSNSGDSRWLVGWAGQKLRCASVRDWQRWRLALSLHLRSGAGFPPSLPRDIYAVPCGILLELAFPPPSYVLYVYLSRSPLPCELPALAPTISHPRPCDILSPCYTMQVTPTRTLAVHRSILPVKMYP